MKPKASRATTPATPALTGEEPAAAYIAQELPKARSIAEDIVRELRSGP